MTNHMRNFIIPAILAKTEKEFRDRLRLIDGLVSMAQIDVMDGHFVPNATWCDMDVVRTLPTSMHFELHLMVTHPRIYIDAAQGSTSIRRMTWHIEADIDHMALITHCHDLGFEAGLAINPKTPIDRLAPYAHHIDQILIMGVEPGWSGQGLIPSTIEKIKRICTMWPHIPLAIDGGVNMQTLPSLQSAGITRFCVASSIFTAEYPRVALANMEKYADTSLF